MMLVIAVVGMILTIHSKHKFEAEWNAKHAKKPTPQSSWTGNTIAPADDNDDADCKPSEPACDPVTQNVMDVMFRRIGDTILSFGKVNVYVDSGYNESTRIRYQLVLEKVQKIKEWADALPSGRTRSAYLSLCESYDDALHEGLDEIAHQGYRKEMQEFERKQAECERQANQYKAKHEMPEPPQ